MKILKQLFLVALFLGVIITANAQEFIATGGCSSISVDGPGAIGGVILIPASEGCTVFSNNPFFVNQILYRIEKKTPDGFVNIGEFPFQFSLETNLDQGTYRVIVFFPTFHEAPNCSNNRIRVRNFSGQFVGYAGALVPITTNEVIVGKPTLEDNFYELIDEGPIPDNGQFEFGQPVLIDMTQNVNYDRLNVSIKQSDSNNWNSTGWIDGPVDQVDLLEVWKIGHPGWKLWANNTYEVRVATANSACVGGWNMNAKQFSVCPAGSGCRFVEGEEEEAIVLSPNPASSRFRLNNLVLDTESVYQLFIYDYTGKLIKEVAQVDALDYDISNLSTGMYLVTVLKDGERVYSDKLSVVK